MERSSPAVGVDAGAVDEIACVDLWCRLLVANFTELVHKKNSFGPLSVIFPVRARVELFPSVVSVRIHESNAREQSQSD